MVLIPIPENVIQNINVTFYGLHVEKELSTKIKASDSIKYWDTFILLLKLKIPWKTGGYDVFMKNIL